MNREPSGQLILSLSAECIPQGDGGVLVRPGRPVFKYTVRQVAKLLSVSKQTVYRLIEIGEMDVERVSPKKTLVFAESVARHCERARDPEYWTAGRLKKLRAAR